MDNTNNLIKNMLLHQKKNIIIKFIISAVIRASLLLLPLFFSKIINFVSFKNYKMAFTYCIFSILFIIIYHIIEYFNQKYYYLVFNGFYYFLNSNLLVATNNNSLFSLSRFTIAEYNNIINNDINIIATFYAFLIIRSIYIIEVLFIYYYFWLINWVLAVISIIITIGITISMFEQRKKLEIINQINKNNLDNKASGNLDYFLNIREIKSFNIINKVKDKYLENTLNYLESNRKYNIKSALLSNIYIFILELFRTILLIYGIYLLIEGQLIIGSLLIIYNYYQKIIEAFTTFLIINSEYADLKVSQKRINKILEYQKTPIYKPSILINNQGTVSFRNIW